MTDEANEKPLDAAAIHKAMGELEAVAFALDHVVRPLVGGVMNVDATLQIIRRANENTTALLERVKP